MPGPDWLPAARHAGTAPATSLRFTGRHHVAEDADHDHVSFDFLGFTFRRRAVRSKAGKVFGGFAPAVSDTAAKAIRHSIRRWRLHHRNEASLADLTRRINPMVRGWVNYYGRFYRSWLARSLAHINDYLVRWAATKVQTTEQPPESVLEIGPAYRSGTEDLPGLAPAGRKVRSWALSAEADYPR